MELDGGIPGPGTAGGTSQPGAAACRGAGPTISRPLQPWSAPPEQAAAAERGAQAGPADQATPPTGSAGHNLPAENAAVPNSGALRGFDAQLVKDSLAPLLYEGPSAMEYMFARLFASSPETRTLFPTSMTALREKAFGALTRTIRSLDNRERCGGILAQLARDHRRYGVTDRHYDLFFAALRDTVEHFLGDRWTEQTSAAWTGALDYMSAEMRAAAKRAARISPPWWVAEIVAHDLRSPGVAVLTLQPGQLLPYQPGQYVPVQVTRWPRVWRPYSIASAPRPTGLIDLHVRAVPGGLVSNTLVYHSSVGDSVLLGGATGGMTLADGDRDLLCVAGGTGLAPIKALIEQSLAARMHGASRKITLFLGARQHFDLYDLEDLQLLESACPALRVVPVLSEEPGYAGLTGLLPDVVRGHGLFENVEAYVCGPAGMVSRAAALLTDYMPSARIHYDPFS